MRRWSSTYEKCEPATQIARQCLLNHDENYDDDVGSLEDSSEDEDVDSDHRGNYRYDDSDEVFESGWPADRHKKHIWLTHVAASANSVPAMLI